MREAIANVVTRGMTCVVVVHGTVRLRFQARARAPRNNKWAQFSFPSKVGIPSEDVKLVLGDDHVLSTRNPSRL